MATVRSAGILLYRRRPGGTEVFLAHMGGPFWARKDDGAWSIPKGEFVEPEAELDAARREFAEEIGTPAPDAAYVRIGEQRLRSGKVVIAYAAEAEFDVDEVRSNEFELEWPPHSGRMASFPEVDRAQWMPLADAERRLVASQRPFLDEIRRSGSS